MTRLFLILILTAVIPHFLSAQYISNVVLQNGKPLSEGQALTVSDTCYFSANTDMLWSLKLYHIDARNTTEYLYAIKTDSIPSKSFRILGDLSDVDKSNKYFWKYFYQENSLDVLFKGVLFATDTLSGVTSEYPLEFNLLPSIPQIIDCNWYNIECHPHPDDGFPTLITDSSYFEVKFTAKNDITRISIWYMMLNFNIQGEENPYLKWSTHFYLYPSDFSHINDTVSFIFPDREVDWGEYIQFSVANRYGGEGDIESDTIFTTDYIENPLYLNEINEFIKWWKETGSSVENIITDNPTSPLGINIDVDKDILRLSSSTGTINSVAIYDTSGRLRLVTNKNDLIDISVLPQAPYIIVCKTNNNELLTAKLLKQ